MQSISSEYGKGQREERTEQALSPKHVITNLSVMCFYIWDHVGPEVRGALINMKQNITHPVFHSIAGMLSLELSEQSVEYLMCVWIAFSVSWEPVYQWKGTAAGPPDIIHLSIIYP